MSLISSIHTINSFVASKSEALTGQRLCKVGYKKTDKIPNPLPSVCVSVPPIDATLITGDILSALIPQLVAVLENAQDGIVRSMNDSSSGQLKSISDSDISIQACIAFLNADSGGARWSKESISVWFKDCVVDNLTVLLADKLGFTELTEDNLVTITKHSDNYRQICELIAGKGITKNSLSASQKKTIRICVKIASEDGRNTIGSRIIAKLDELEKIPSIEDALELDVD